MKYNNQMPIIPLDKLNLTQEQLELAQGIINSKTGQLRASKPQTAVKVEFEDPNEFFGRYLDYTSEADEKTGKTAYIWRMCVFFLSNQGPHQCMPVTADFDLPGKNMAERRIVAKELDIIVDAIINAIPLNQQPGTVRWGRALGII